MSRIEAVKVALDPTPRQRDLLASNAGGARFAYNTMLAHVKEQLQYNESVTANDKVEVDWTQYALRRWWNANKDALAPWWGENSKEAYSYAAECLGKGLKNFSTSKKGKRKGRKVGFPKFKSKSSHKDAFAYTTGFRQPSYSDANALVLPRIGRVHCMENVYRRVGDGRVLRITVSKKAERWFASLTVEFPDDRAKYIKNPDTIVGVDLGVKSLATLSDGTVVENPKYYKQSQRKLRKAQKTLSRRIKGSNRREKARVHVAKLQANIANQRNDCLHKLITKLVRTYGGICIEDLNVQGMMKNHRLAKSIADASFYEFRRQLEYKAFENGNIVYIADRFYPSSKKCSSCGSVKAKLDLNERTYYCDHCGLVIDRDLNAAVNLMLAASAAES